MNKLKVAFCLRGSIGKENSVFMCENELYNNQPYVDYKKCYNSIIKYIINPNNDKYEFDFFCHCWNQDLENDIINLYKPIKYMFENNNNYNILINSFCINNTDYGGISQALTIKKSIELKEKYEFENNFNYDIVILYRYDIFLWKEIILNNYNLNDYIYVNAHENCNGDFHFIMNNNNSFFFKYLFDSIKLGNKHNMHYWIKNYIINYMKKELLMDNIIPGINQEVIRKIYLYSIFPGHLSLELFNSI